MGMATLLATMIHTAYGASENLLVARYTPFRFRSLAYGAKFVLALGVGGVTVHLAGELFDHTGSFNLLYIVFAACGIASAAGALFLPRWNAPAPAQPATAQA